MTKEDFDALQPGAVIQSLLTDLVYIVTGHYGTHATAIRTADVTHPNEWRLLAHAAPLAAIEEDEYADTATPDQQSQAVLREAQAWLRVNERSEAYLARQLNVDRTVLHRVLNKTRNYTPAPGRHTILTIMQRLTMFLAHQKDLDHA